MCYCSKGGGKGRREKQEGRSKQNRIKYFLFKTYGIFLSPHVGDCDCTAKAQLDMNCNPLGYCSDVRLRLSSLPHKSISL